METSAPTVQGGEQGDRRQATHHTPQGPWDGQPPLGGRGRPTPGRTICTQHPRVMLKHRSVTQQARPENSTGAGAGRPRSVLLLEGPDTSTTICQGCGSAPRIPAPGPEAGDTDSPVLRVSRTQPTHSCGAQRRFVSLKITVQNGGGLERPPNGDNQGRLPPRVESEHPGGGHPEGGHPAGGNPGGATGSG